LKLAAAAAVQAGGGIMNPTIFYLLDFGLFLAVLIIILFYRQLDRKDRQIHLVKALMENMQFELDEKFKKMRTAVEAMEDTMQGYEIHVSTLLKKVDSSLADLDRHADDLQKLHSYMSHYHRVLKDLEGLTGKAEARMKLLKADTEELGNIGERIEVFSQEVEALEEKLSIQSGKFLEQVEKARTDWTEQIAREVEESIRFANDQITKKSEEAAAAIDISKFQMRHETAADEEVPPSVEGVFSLPRLEEIQMEIEEIDNPDEPDDIDNPDEPDDIDDPDEPDDLDAEEIDMTDDEEDIQLYMDDDEVQAIEEKLSKREIVQRYASEGKDSSSIAAMTGIPRGEVELILELMDFTKDE
jgi:myosin heavy subunit